MTEPADLSNDPINPVRALLDIAPAQDGHPQRVALELLAPAWDALDQGETACLAHMEAGPGPRYMAPMADLCNHGCDLVAAAARAAVAGEPRSTVDEHLHRAADLVYLCALALPRLPEAVHPALDDVATALAVGHEPDLYTRVLDTLTPQPDAVVPESGSDGNPDARRFAVAARAVGYDLAVRGIRRASARVAASMVPLARLAAVCLAATRAPHQEAAGMRRDVALFIASTDDTMRELLADISAWLAGSPRHHAYEDRPSDNAGWLDNAVEALWALATAPGRIDSFHSREAEAASSLRDDGTLRWIEWAANDVSELVEVLREHEDAVRQWHRAIGTPAFYREPDHPGGDGDEGDEDGDRTPSPKP